jgi:hypothetical protein
MTTTYGNGRYQAQVLSQGFETSSAKGTPGFVLQVRILGRYDEQGQLQECQHFERTCPQWLGTETGVNIFRAQLRVLGVEVTNFAQLEPGAPGHISLVGSKVDVGCTVETREGRQQERWSILTPRKKLGTEAIRALDDAFGHLLRGGSGQARPSTPVTQPNDSDVPF